jgi:large subunit ribosomal protein L2
MGKRIQVQRRGRGTVNFQSPTHKRRGAVKYRHYLHTETGPFKATIKDLLHDPGRGAPVALVQYEDGTKGLYLPPEGIKIGDTFEIGHKTEIKVGNILLLENIPEGTYIYNVEGQRNDGGKFVRGSGGYAVMMTKTPTQANIRLPSGKVKRIPLNARATVGVVAGGGRQNKPFVKAGTKYYLMKTRHRVWPKVSGVAMNASSHPFGGGGHKSPHKPTTISRNAPPGRKVGLIAARRTGTRK